MKTLPANKIIIFPLLLIFFLGLISCDNSGSNQAQSNPGGQSNESEVLSVSDYEFLFNDTETGGAITFQFPGVKQCRVSFIKSSFTQGYSTRINSIGQGDMDLTCMTDKNLFILNDTGNTYAEISIPKVSGKATVKLSFSLYSIKSKSSLTKENVTLVLDEEQLTTLLQSNPK